MATEKIMKFLRFIKTHKVFNFDAELVKNLEFVEKRCGDDKEMMVFRLATSKLLCNLHGSIHGGALCTAVDCVTSVHAWASDPQERIAISTELALTFLLPVMPGDVLEITTQVLGASNSMVFTTAQLSVDKKSVGRGNQTLCFIDKSSRIYVNS